MFRRLTRTPESDKIPLTFQKGCAIVLIKSIYMFTIIVFTLGLFIMPGCAYETAGEAIELFNGKNLDGWQGSKGDNKWSVAENVMVSKKDNIFFEIVPGEGVMVNGKDGKTVHLLSDFQHGDCQLHIEFTVPFGSNSGVYFQGLYEIQIFDSYKKETVTYTDCGAIYARWDCKKAYEGYPPSKNVSLAQGEWQSFDVVFRAPRFDKNGKKIENAKFVTVKHNGVVVHENVEVTGGTRSHIDKPESAKGQLMLQGDHGPVAFRNIVLIPLELP